MTWIAWGGLPNRESKAWLLRADQRKTSRTVALAGSNPNVMRLSLNSKFAQSVFSNFAVSTAAGASAAGVANPRKNGWVVCQERLRGTAVAAASMQAAFASCGTW